MSSTKPPADDFDREHFYDEAPDDDEYELEPPDAEVTAAREQHIAEVAATAESKIDVDELFRDAELRDHDKLLVDALETGYRFQIKHLLQATAVLSLFLAVCTITGSLWVAMFLFVLTGTSIALIYLNRRERQHEAELEAKKREFRERQKALRDRQFRRERADEGPSDGDSTEPLSAEVDPARQGEPADDPYEFALNFSLKQLMVAMTVSAIVFGLMSWLTPQYLAMMLGLVALGGLVIVTTGFEPPRMVVLGWWLLLMLYVLVSVVAMFWREASVQ